MPSTDVSREAPGTLRLHRRAPDQHECEHAHDRGAQDRRCPPSRAHRLDADEAAILDAVAEHYRRYEWSPATGGWATQHVARHAVPSRKEAQTALLTSIPYDPRFASAVPVELERHGVPPDLARALQERLRSRNAARVDLVLPQTTGLAKWSCRDFFALAHLGTRPRGGLGANASKPVAISLPAFDDARKTALVLTNNTIGYLTDGTFDDVELTLLEARSPVHAARDDGHAPREGDRAL